MPYFSPQKEFPEILGGSNKSLALHLLQTVLVSELGQLIFRSRLFNKPPWALLGRRVWGYRRSSFTRSVNLC